MTPADPSDQHAGQPADQPVPGAKWFAGYDAGDPASAAADAVLTDRFTRLTAAYDKVRDRLTDKRIRKLRVTTRRADLAVRFAEPRLAKKKAARVRGSLRSLRRAGGAVRRCDLYIERLGRLLDRSAASDVRPAATAIVGQLAAERAAAVDALAAQIAHDAPRQPDQRACAAGKNDAPQPQQSGSVLAARLLSRAADAFRRQSTAAPLEVEPLHDLRLRAKKLRYAAELAVPVVGAEAAGDLIAALVPLQDELGTLNDVAELADALTGAVQQFASLQSDPAGLRRGAERLFLAASAERDRRLVAFSVSRAGLIRDITDALEPCLSAAAAARRGMPDNSSMSRPADSEPSGGLRLTGEAGWGVG
ncbi:MAG: CHAD domain-containing protein [Planctomycetota bacterium]